ncbi:MAG: CopG family transcriptional regulator [Neisseriaceae bacterium]|nr:CopG family transcriptional regulator [Neisseriaceae bacterium]MBR1819345.1 CopG family transcriptional regulator [Neisseriaceae bacterium]
MSIALETYSVKLPPTLIQKMDTISERLERSRDWALRQAVSSWVRQEEERHQMILEALDDVDNGRLIEHNTIREWAKNLNV